MTVDHQIIEDCKAGKRRAQSMLYKQFSAAMLGVCLRYSANLAEAEDILQEGFIKVFSNIRSLKENAAIGSWIRKIMVNSAISQAAKKKFLFEQIDDDHMPEPEPEEETFLPVDPETLISIIQGLPGGYRMVLNLYVFEGYSHREIAQMLNISENTSKTQLFKARKAIKKGLESHNLKNNNLVENETRI